MIGAIPVRTRGSRRSIAGVTLIELMVALVLGLIVAGAAMAVFITTRQTYVATESLGRLQESARVAFELMSRDLREATTIPCSNETVLNNVVDSTQWWAARDATGADPLPQWNSTSFLGYTSGGSDAVQLIAAVSPRVEPIVVTTAPAAPATLPVNLVVNSADALTAGDLLMVCDYGYFDEGPPPVSRAAAGAIFQASSVDTASNTISITTGGTPGNAAGNLYNSSFEPASPQLNGIVTVLRPTRWFIGDNTNGGKSLFRTRLLNTAGALSTVDDEIVADADNMTLTYLEKGGAAYVAAVAVVDWSEIRAVRIQLHLTGADRVDGAPIERTLEHVVTVRNRAL